MANATAARLLHKPYTIASASSARAASIGLSRASGRNANLPQANSDSWIAPDYALIIGRSRETI
jgi:hypothetical protein